VLKNSVWVPDEGYKAAVQAGYRISRPRRITNKLKMLAWNLGKQYHLAQVGCWNSIHRVLGDGWSVVVFPVRVRSDWYVVEVRNDYDREIVGRVHGVHEEYVPEYIQLLIDDYVPAEIAGATN